MSPPDPPSLWTTSNIAGRLGVTQERARQLSHRSDFPEPSYRHGPSRFWAVADVEAWIAEHRPEQAKEDARC